MNWPQPETVNPKPIGLVLAGGYSRRFGRDKGLVLRDGIPARLSAAKLILPFCSDVYLSLRPDQMEDDSQQTGTAPSAAFDPPDFPILVDQFPGDGPMGALCTAFASRPADHWLVIPCDMPYLDAAALSALTVFWQKHQTDGNENPHAVFLRHPDRKLPEMLCGIYQANAGPIVMEVFRRGEHTMKALLDHLQWQSIPVSRPEVLFNQNTASDR